MGNVCTCSAVSWRKSAVYIHHRHPGPDGNQMQPFPSAGISCHFLFLWIWELNVERTVCPVFADGDGAQREAHLRTTLSMPPDSLGHLRPRWERPPWRSKTAAQLGCDSCIVHILFGVPITAPHKGSASSFPCPGKNGCQAPISHFIECHVLEPSVWGSLGLTHTSNPGRFQDSLSPLLVTYLHVRIGIWEPAGHPSLGA